ncbi:MULTISPECIES: metal ABC transporter substrate-binding protein [Clostridium]|uniref:metal ABC transporter substrate-binding protein n=1 Tax=Clostridium TaxID=1485 RepID=UPI000826EC6F|nr:MULTISPECIES: metal ABC transporter substrate-binding protein [Clostridium]PJI09213.1 zinc-binding protein [Clostridium sp. CT7]
MKKFFCFFINVILIVTLVGCGNGERTNVKVPSKTTDGKSSNVSLDIMVSNRMLYNVVKDMSGDRHNVQFMFKDDKTITDFKYTSDSVNNVSKYDIFMYLGADFEPWASDFIGKLNKSSISTVDMSRGTKILDLNNKIKYGDVTIDKNPYYWTDLGSYKTMLVNVKNSLEEKDPKSRDFYEKKFSQNIKKVNDVEKDFKLVNDKLKDYTFVTDDYQFDYFLKYAGVDSISLTEDQMSKPDDKDLDNKLKDKDKLVYIYNDDSKLQTNNAVIQKYKMKTLKFITYDEYSDYVGTMKKNIEAMNELIK